MSTTLPPDDDAARVAALRAYQILDSPPEMAFERITHLASEILGMPIALITFVDSDRQWFKSAVGIDIQETPREFSFCTHALQVEDLLVVPDAAADPRFANNPYVVGEPNVGFYAGAPLRTPEGNTLGTLCVLDRCPRTFSERESKILRDLAALVLDELTLRFEIGARHQAEAALRAQHQALKEANSSVERRVEERTAELTCLNETLGAEIHRRELADSERHHSERRFRQLFNQASDAAFVHDTAGCFVDVNNAACASLGYTRDELLALGVKDIEAAHLSTEGQQFWRELPPGSVDKFEGCHRRKDGSTFPVEIHLSVLDTAEGRRLLALVRDITGRKQAEEAMRARARRQEAVANLGTRALGGVDELIRDATTLTCETLESDLCRVFEYLPAENAFRARAGAGGAAGTDGSMVSGADADCAGQVLRTGEPVLVQDSHSEIPSATPMAAHPQGAKRGIYVLIGGPNPGDLRFGVLSVATHVGQVFSEDDVFFAQSVANVLAAAIVRRRKEDDLRIVEARFRRISANTPGVVYQYLIPASGPPSLPFISESCRALFGREAREIQANPQYMREIIHPEDRPRFAEIVQQAVQAAAPIHWQGRYRLPNGETRWVRLDSRPERLPDGGTIYDGIIIDMTQERINREALHQTEERFRLAIVHSPFPVMLHANDGEVVQVNDAWTHITGYMADELPTLEDWYRLAYADEKTRESARAYVADLTNHIGTSQCLGQHVRCADGDERIWDFTSANLDRLPDGRWLHITTAIDVTERQQAEAALRAAKEEAERANRAKTVFLSRMSHELRTPLNAILGFGQLLEMSALDKQDALSLNYILKGGRHLLSLIDEVLDLSRAETGELHLVLGHVNLAALAEECVGLVARLAQARGITCQVKVPRQTVLWTDEQRLRQMLLNLLSNAIKYNVEGGKVVVSSKKMPSGQVRLRVLDTGPGISREGLAKLFMPFERLEQEYGEVEGTGLGLVVSQRIAEAMGGSVGVESEVGQGSTFWIELPLSASQTVQPPLPAVSTRSPVRAASAPPNAKLLYIEDNVSNLLVVQALLNNSRPHWSFLSAHDGEQGLALARQELPSLILLDLQLPGIKGDAVLAELRRDPTTQQIPVVLLSADATAHSRERLLAVGADDYISKPFKLDQLLSLLDRTLLQAAAT